jgi:hypothetical protein
MGSFRKIVRRWFDHARRFSEHASTTTDRKVVIHGFVGKKGIVTIPARSVCTIGHLNLIVKNQSRLASKLP